MMFGPKTGSILGEKFQVLKVVDPFGTDSVVYAVLVCFRGGQLARTILGVEQLSLLVNSVTLGTFFH